MQKMTHQFISCGFTALLFSIFMTNFTWWFFCSILAYIAGPINDSLDFKVFQNLEHRNKYTHSFYPKIIARILIFILLLIFLELSVLGVILLIILNAYLSHVGIDSLNFSGIHTPSGKISGKIHYKSIPFNQLLQIAGVVGTVLGGLNVHFAVFHRDFPTWSDFFYI